MSDASGSRGRKAGVGLGSGVAEGGGVDDAVGLGPSVGEGLGVKVTAGVCVAVEVGGALGVGVGVSVGRSVEVGDGVEVTAAVAVSARAVDAAAVFVGRAATCVIRSRGSEIRTITSGRYNKRCADGCACTIFVVAGIDRSCLPWIHSVEPNSTKATEADKNTADTARWIPLNPPSARENTADIRDRVCKTLDAPEIRAERSVRRPDSGLKSRGISMERDGSRAPLHGQRTTGQSETRGMYNSCMVKRPNDTAKEAREVAGEQPESLPRDRAEQALLRQNRELTILNEVAHALNGSAALDQALRVTLEQATDHFDLDSGWIWLLDETGERSYVGASIGLPPALGDVPKRMSGRCYCLDAFRTGELRGAANIGIVRCSRLRDLESGTRGLRFHASVPIEAGGRRLGLMNLGSKEARELSSDELRLLLTIGDLLGIAVERARLHDSAAEIGALRERVRVARELHDTLAQGLTAIALQLEVAEAQTEEAEADDPTRPVIRRALELTRDSLDGMRRAVHDLRAAPLEGSSLEHALADLGPTTGLNLSLELVDSERPLPARIEVALYRIAQEAVTNVARHSGVSDVSVRLECTPRQASITVRDNGRGFDTESVAGDRHGLIGMQERARLLNGSLDIQSSPSAGTEVRVRLPLLGEDAVETEPAKGVRGSDEQPA